jgi:non-heme chloroperoxidase
MHTQYIDGTDGARIAYHVFGDGPPQVLLVHGWMVSSKVWRALIPFIQERGVVAVDLRGTGESSAGSKPLSLELLAEDVLTVARRLDVPRLDLCGHSMGGQVAQIAAVLAPGLWRSLTLINPVPVSGLELPDPLARQFRAAGGMLGAFEEIVDSACQDLMLSVRVSMIVDALGIEPRIIAEGFDAFSRGVPELALALISTPTLVVGSDDPFLPPRLLDEKVVERIRGARRVHVRGAGHYPMLERPSETAGALVAHWGRA